MTAKEFRESYKRLDMSRAAFCRALGLGRRTGDDYAFGRTRVPLYVKLAIERLEQMEGRAA